MKFMSHISTFYPRRVSHGNTWCGPFKTNIFMNLFYHIKRILILGGPHVGWPMKNPWFYGLIWPIRPHIRLRCVLHAAPLWNTYLCPTWAHLYPRWVPRGIAHWNPITLRMHMAHGSTYFSPMGPTWGARLKPILMSHVSTSIPHMSPTWEGLFKPHNSTSSYGPWEHIIISDWSQMGCPFKTHAYGPRELIYNSHESHVGRPI